MGQNSLQLNKDKTEIVIFGAKDVGLESLSLITRTKPEIHVFNPVFTRLLVIILIPVVRCLFMHSSKSSCSTV